VELGTHSGVSFSAFCHAVLESGFATRCHAVDTWRGDAHAGEYDEEVFQEFQRFHDERFATFSTLLRCSFDEALGKIADTSIDLLHIDGLHTFDAARHDFLSWLPKLSERAVVLLHDTNERDRDFGVWRLWEELRERYPSFEFLHGHGLGVLAVGFDAPLAVKDLCGLSNAVEVARVRSRFASLGERWLRETEFQRFKCDARLDIESIQSTADQTRAALERNHSEVLAAAEIRAEQSRAALEQNHSEALAAAEIRAEQTRAALAQSHSAALAAAETLAAQIGAALEQSRSELAAKETQMEHARLEHERLVERMRRDAARQVDDASANAWRLAESARVAEQRAEAAQAAASASAIRAAAIENSTLWRSMRPIRSILGRFPRLRRAPRQLLRFSWWTVTLQLPRRLRERQAKLAIMRTLLSSNLFDRDWYLQQHRDVASAHLDPAVHFLIAGASERRSPGPNFDTEWYMTAYPDVAATGMNPLIHYIERGKSEGRHPTPHPLFDAQWYLDQNPDVRATGISPLKHFIESGWTEGRNPSLLFDVHWYLAHNPDVRSSGINPLIHYILNGRAEGRPATSSHSSIAATVDIAEAMLEKRLPTVRRLPILSVTNSSKRITIVTDTLDQTSFFGGVATSLIVATALARASDRSLRIATRVSYPNADNYLKLLEASGMPSPRAIEAYSDFDPSRAMRHRLDVSPNDVFLTTSWWSTYALLKSGFVGKIFYLIQECEPMFYPSGDEQLMVHRILGDQRLHFIVNSQLLYEYLVNIEGHRGVARSAVVFEPALPQKCICPAPTAFHEKERYRLFFYARPGNPRNLFETGIGLLDRAIRAGVLDTERFEVCLAGSSLAPLQFANGHKPTIFGKMDWSDYFAFLVTVDVGLALMYSPHPSYPPLDVAAAGGVALTNTYANKTSLENYSPNILCFDPMAEDSAERALESALALAMDTERRRANYESSGFCKDWNTSLRQTLEFFIRNT
jgi:hypothetical protein